jgi:hypothetical protein
MIRVKTIQIILFGTMAVALTACLSESKEQKDNVHAEEKEAEYSPSKDTLNSEVAAYISSLEAQHRQELWYQKEVIQFDLKLMFGGKSRFHGTLYMTPDGGKVRMEDAYKVMIWDGKEAYLSPDTVSYPKARFDLLTWSYFFAAPYKLSDPGTKHEYLGVQPLGEENYPALKLTFADGVGDSPDDWYIVYQSDSSHLLAAMAYIVTYSQSKKKAEENPHLITYEAYTEVDGIPFATQWNFWSWNKSGEMKKLLGTASLSNIKFIKKAEHLFQPSAYYKVVDKPTS